MSAGQETTRADQWLFEKLTGDATLTSLVGSRVYGYGAPQDAVLPYVVFLYLGGSDLRVVGPARIWADLVYAVKGVAQVGSFGGNLKTIADRIDIVLHAAKGTVTGGEVFACVRETTIAFREIEAGKEYRHLGGTFRLLAQGT